MRSEALRRLGSAVNHESVLVRFVSFWALIATVFTIAWVGSYLWLPQGLLRGGHPVAGLEFAGSIPREFLTLFGWNVAVSLVAIGANTFRSVETPLSYLVLGVQSIQYGIVWGTGSLAVGSGARIVPSVTVILDRSGQLEITAIVAIVVATREVMLWHQASGPRWREPFDRVRSPRDWSFGRADLILLGIGYLLLAAAAYWEAVAIAGLVG